MGGLFNGTASPLDRRAGRSTVLYLAIPASWSGPCGRPATPALQPPPKGRSEKRAALPSGPWCGAASDSCGCCRPAATAGALSSTLTDAAAGEPGGLAHMQALPWRTPSGAGEAWWPWSPPSSPSSSGVGPILFRHSSIFLVAGVAMALDFWVLGQAFGQVFTGMATDPDTGPLLILLALAVYRADRALSSGARSSCGTPQEAPPAISTRAGTLVS